MIIECFQEGKARCIRLKCTLDRLTGHYGLVKLQISNKWSVLSNWAMLIKQLLWWVRELPYGSQDLVAFVSNWERVRHFSFPSFQVCLYFWDSTLLAFRLYKLTRTCNSSLWQLQIVTYRMGWPFCTFAQWCLIRLQEWSIMLFNGHLCRPCRLACNARKVSRCRSDQVQEKCYEFFFASRRSFYYAMRIGLSAIAKSLYHPHASKASPSLLHVYP